MAQYVYTMRRVGKVVPPKREILKNISLSFFPGAKIGVLGLNGSGKSTLLAHHGGRGPELRGRGGADAEHAHRLPAAGAAARFAKTVRESVEEGLGDVLAAKKRLDESTPPMPSPTPTSTSSPRSRRGSRR